MFCLLYGNKNSLVGILFIIFLWLDVIHDALMGLSLPGILEEEAWPREAAVALHPFIPSEAFVCWEDSSNQIG